MQRDVRKKNEIHWTKAEGAELFQKNGNVICPELLIPDSPSECLSTFWEWGTGAQSPSDVVFLLWEWWWCRH